MSNLNTKVLVRPCIHYKGRGNKRQRGNRISGFSGLVWVGNWLKPFASGQTDGDLIPSNSSTTTRYLMASSTDNGCMGRGFKSHIHHNELFQISPVSNLKNTPRKRNRLDVDASAHISGRPAIPPSTVSGGESVTSFEALFG